MEKRYLLENLSCPSCAAKIEAKIGKLDGVREAVVNFTAKKLIVTADENIDDAELLRQIRRESDLIEPGQKVREENFRSDKQESRQSHEHDHGDTHGGSLKSQTVKLIAALAAFTAAVVTEHFFAEDYAAAKWISIILFAVSYITAGFPVLSTALKNMARGRLFDENFLMAIATVGAIAIKEYPEAAAVMLFYQFGEVLQDYAVGKSKKSITDLMDIRPDYANIKRGEEFVKLSPDEAVIGDVILVKPGEKIPLDGKVLSGESMLNTVALTGESILREVSAGAEVLSGFVNVNGALTVRAEKSFGESTVSKILELMENSGSKKAVSEKFITKFARYYTPVVVIVALFVAILPPLVIGISDINIWFDWIRRALVFLVISCPCALVISVPLGFFAGIGGASKAGILIKGGNYLEALSKARTVVFDKTGTLTKGVFKVTEINPIDGSAEQLLEIAATAESLSNHPIAISLREAWGREIDSSIIENQEEKSGMGIQSIINGEEVYAGNAALMESIGLRPEKQHKAGTVVHVAKNARYLGHIIISDEIKEDSKATVRTLHKKLGIKSVMLTGDNILAGSEAAREIGIEDFHTDLLPADKVERVEELIKAKKDGESLLFIGDGINDAPVLAMADVGIAMGGLGSDAAIEAADAVIMTDEPSKVITAIEISKKTMYIIKQNIVFAITVKLIILLLGLFGIASMWLAVFGDVGVSIIAIINATRAMKKR